MKGKYLGELEELILLTVGALKEKAYAVSVMDEIAEKMGRLMNISAIHAVLKRLETKGFVSSEMGGATRERGGRRKRYFLLTLSGRKALDFSMSLRSELSQLIPKTSH